MVNFDAIFFAQGVIDMCYWIEMTKTREEMMKSLFAPASVLLWCLTYAITSPQNFTGVGFIFFYPLYTKYYIQCLHTTGTWMWLNIVIWFSQCY